MDKKAIVALLALAAAFVAACSGYLIDKDPNHLYGDGGMLLLDGSLPGQGDGGVPAGLDASAWQPPDTGFGKPCNTEVRNIELTPLDLLVVLDVSYSMDYDQKWSNVKSALKSFANNPQSAGLGVGLQYFPLRAQCNVDDYQAPAVSIDVLGGATSPQAKAIVASLDQQQMGGGTPTTQVLEGTSAYVKGWLARPANANHKAVIVLATDGMPDSTCASSATIGLPNSIANALTVASQAAQNDPQVKTFVIGVGKDLAPLDSLASAGGTGSAILVDATANADLAFFNALMSIRRSALGCVFQVPPNATGQDGEIDPKNAQVRFTPDDGSGTEYFYDVGDYDGCSGSGGYGWYFDDPNDPTSLILCDDACSEVTQGKTGKLDVEFACKWTPT